MENYAHINLGPAHQLATGLRNEREGLKVSRENLAERSRLQLSRLVAIEEGQGLPTWDELDAILDGLRPDRDFRQWMCMKLGMAIEDLDYQTDMASAALSEDRPHEA